MSRNKIRYYVRQDGTLGTYYASDKYPWYVTVALIALPWVLFALVTLVW